MTIDIDSLFRPAAPLHCVADGERSHRRLDADIDLVVDSFPADGACCCALRSSSPVLELALAGPYRLQQCAAGGWLIEAREGTLPTYWLPQLPRQRSRHPGGPIRSDAAARIAAFDAGATGLCAEMQADADRTLELAVWRFAPEARALVEELRKLLPAERQPAFLYASHCNWTQPADLYLHFAHGHVYERAGQWPLHWRIRDELDAYAIYLICGAHGLQTGKRLYRLLQSQVVLSVLAHQEADGGFRHGEWTQDIESHYRMAAGGLHLLAAEQQAMPSPGTAGALARAADWLARQTDTLQPGPWLLHDSLEQSAAALAKSPFRHARSRALGKSETNLLVLNTHLDNTLALLRCDEVLGAARHSELADAALRSTQAVLGLRSGEWLYRVLFPWVRLTMLPEARARALPLPVRMLKRLAWRWLRPHWHQVKAKFPRLLMPGGYIERDLTLASFAVQYLPVNLWDLARMQRRRPDPALRGAIDGALAFMRRYDLMTLWSQQRGWGSALSYLGEALRVLALDDPSLQIRHDLAHSLVLAQRCGLGAAPGLLAPSAEVTAGDGRRTLLRPAHPDMILVQLGRVADAEVMAVNAGNVPLPLTFEGRAEAFMAWTIDGTACNAGATLEAGRWALGQAMPAALPAADRRHTKPPVVAAVR